MATPERYTVRHEPSGRLVTFEWEGDAPPTDEDYEAVFEQAGLIMRDEAAQAAGVRPPSLPLLRPRAPSPVPVPGSRPTTSAGWAAQGAGTALVEQGARLGQAAAQVPGIKQISDALAPRGMTADQAIEAFLKSQQPELPPGAYDVGRIAGELAPAIVMPVKSAMQEGILGAVQAQATGGNPVVGGIMAASTRGVGQQVPRVGRYLRNWGKRQFERAIDPTKQGPKAIMRLQGAKMLEDPQFRGKSLEDMLAYAENNRARAGRSVQAAKSQFGQDEVSRRSIARIDTALDKLLAKKTLHGQDVAPSAGFIREFKQIFLNATTELLPDGTVIPRKLTVEGLQTLINGRDEIVERAGGYAGRQLADATNAYVSLEARRLMARELYKTAPDLKTVNQAYHYWANATDLLKASTERKTGQQRTMHNIFKFMLGLGGGSGAYATGGDPFLGAVTGGAIAGLTEAATTPQWRSVSAHLKKRLARSIENDDWTAAQRILGRMMAAGSAQVATSGEE